MKRFLLMVTVIGVTQLLIAPSSGQTNRFFYDNLGRLGVVLDASGTNAAFYNYDAVGNITSIVRKVVGPVNLFFFSPASGSANQTNILQGTGFSTNLAQNTVVFGAVTAQVVSAKGNQLKVLVPTNASSSLIRVTTPSGSFTNARTFTANIGVQVTPGAISVSGPFSTQFVATVYGSVNQGVTWNLNGWIPAGSNSLWGLITTNGFYTSPITPPPASAMTVRARSVADPDPLKDGVARIAVLAPLGPIYSPPITCGQGLPTVLGPIWSPTVSSQSGLPTILGPIYSPTVSAGPR